MFAQTCRLRGLAGDRAITPARFRPSRSSCPRDRASAPSARRRRTSSFGTGGSAGKVAPWTDPALYFVRSSGTGTIQMPSRAIHVPATQWWGIDRLSADNLRDSMEGIDPDSAEKAIGIFSADFADRARANLRVLDVSGDGPELRLLARLDRRRRSTSPTCATGTIRSGGRSTSSRPTSTACPSQAAGALVDALLGAAARSDAARRVHRLEPRARVRDEGAAHAGAGRAVVVPAAVRVRLLLRGQRQRHVDLPGVRRATPATVRPSQPACNLGYLRGAVATFCAQHSGIERQ